MPGMVSDAVILNRISLQAFAASFSPHWLDGPRSPAGRLPLPELCVEILRSESLASQLKPNGFTLDAFLLLLGLAAAHPENVILLREAESSQDPPEPPDETPPPPLTKQSLNRTWSRALTVTIGATMRGFPAALLLNSRTETGAPKHRRFGRPFCHPALIWQKGFELEMCQNDSLFHYPFFCILLNVPWGSGSFQAEELFGLFN
eukprot:Skav210539  [mRNA]  locus=scaffold3045:404102:405520:- [translate_table: standard]